MLLHFAEPEKAKAGDRVFTVALQGKEVLKDFDIVDAANGSNRSIVREIKGVSVKETLEIVLTPKAGKTLLAGVEFVAE